MMLDFIETSGADIESAVMRALSELGVTRDQVRVDVIEEPLRRPLGLGTRPARVRVTVVSRPTSAEPVASVSQPQVPATPKVIAAPPPADPPIADAITASVKPPEAKPIPAVPRHFDADDEEHDASSTPAELDEEADMSTDILRTLLAHMRIKGEVFARRAEINKHEAPHWILEIRGRDLAGLIGTKGEMLIALQYITRLIASHELSRRANVVVDVEGYKARKEMMLKRLAKRMAEQAIERGRPISLEPMPPQERRIIHLALRDHPSVTTESVGEGDRRKVTIVPRKGQPH